MSGLMRRKRLADGSLGELEKVFEGETEEERIERLEQENRLLKEQLRVNGEVTDFHEELIAELAMKLY